MFFDALGGSCLNCPVKFCFMSAGFRIAAMTVKGFVGHSLAKEPGAGCTGRAIAASGPGFDNFVSAAGVDEDLFVDFLVVAAVDDGGFAFVGDGLASGIKHGDIAIDGLGGRHPDMFDEGANDGATDDDRLVMAGVDGDADACSVVSGGEAEVEVEISSQS